MPDTDVIHEASRKSGVIWVAAGGRGPRAAWHVWFEGADHVLVDGGEQVIPGLAQAATAEVTVRARSSDTGLLRWTAAVAPLDAGSAGWEALEPLLRKARLHAEPDPTPRWRAGSTLLRLTPIPD